MTYTVLELFSGAGGLALGLEHAGFQLLKAIDNDKDSCATLKLNRPDWDVVCGDVREMSYEGLTPDLVVGGFPCQSFSTAGLKRGFEDTRGTMFFELARCVKETRPKIVIGENVKGLLSHDNGQTLNVILDTLASLGYRVKYKLLKAQNYDVPQKRERVIIIGIRDDLDLDYTFPESLGTTVTLKEALADVPQSEGITYSEAKRKVLELVPPGGCWRDLPVDIQKSYMGASYYQTGGRTGIARRMSWDELSLTLTCSPSQKISEKCHPSEVRPFTVREWARIQTFPDSWQFVGSISSRYKQIGNAVPVNFAYHIGKSVMDCLNKVSK